MTRVFLHKGQTRKPFGLKSHSFLLFCFFIGILPLFRLNLFRSYSLDNLLAPFLLLLWITTNYRNFKTIFTKRHFSYFILIFIYIFSCFFVELIKFNTTNLKLEILSQLKYILYLLLPILYLQSLDQIFTIIKILFFSTLVICCTAFLNSIGYISLHFLTIANRASDTGRFFTIQFANLPRSAGLIGEFGTLAVLISFSLSVIAYIIYDQNKRRFKTQNILFKNAFFLIPIVLAMIVAQSRNVYLSCSIMFIIIIYHKILTQRKGSKIYITNIFMFLVAISFCIAIIINFSHLYLYIVGNSAMKQSVYYRFDQYSWATNAILDNILSGADGAFKIKYSERITFIHNFWLNQLLRFGIIGTLPILFIFLKLIIDLFHFSKNLLYSDISVHLTAFSFSFIFAGMFYASHGSVYYWYFIGFLIAFDSIVYRELNRNNFSFL